MKTFRRLCAYPLELLTLVLFISTAAVGYLALKVSGDKL